MFNNLETLMIKFKLSLFEVINDWETTTVYRSYQGET